MFDDFDLAFEALPDFTKEQQTKKEYKVPPAGIALARLVGYVELGKHEESYMGQDKVVDKVELVFELHGKNYPVENGNPMRVTVKENLSMFPKSNFHKLFMQMKGGDESVRHPAQLVGRGFKVRVHNTTSANGNTYAVLKTKDKFYDVSAPVREDAETGEIVTVNVPAMISKPKVFVWNQATKKQWDSLFIDGQYNDGNSKNVLQDKIRSAVNYKGSKAESLDRGVDFHEIVKEVKPATHFDPQKSSRFARNQPKQDDYELNFE